MATTLFKEVRYDLNTLIVDGQQRLTSLYAVLKSREVIRENYDKEKIVISFKPTTSD